MVNRDAFGQSRQFGAVGKLDDKTDVALVGIRDRNEREQLTVDMNPPIREPADALAQLAGPSGIREPKLKRLSVTRARIDPWRSSRSMNAGSREPNAEDVCITFDR